jgi:hypothetical protein
LQNFGTFSFNFPPSFFDITGTPDGCPLGIDCPAGNLDICCWHDEYITYPSFLKVLAWNPNNTVPGDTAAVAIGGKCVVIEPGSRYEYAAKIVCGIQNEPDNLRLARGVYATTINIHNPNNTTVEIFKKLALTYPPGKQLPGEVIPISTDTLGPDQALETDCMDIETKLFPNGFPTPYIEGFVIIQSPLSIDVSAVYSAAKLGEVTSFDVEQIREREIEGPQRLPDLVPVPIPGCTGNPVCFCDRQGDTLTVTVRNQGTAPAGPSVTEVDFGNCGTFTEPTKELVVGEETKVKFIIPSSCCFKPNCEFRIKVDATTLVTESDEINNTASGICPG